MARVRYPLWSLSASGSVGEQICYGKAGGEPPRTINRARDGEAIAADYPRRQISGAGIARLKPGYRGDLRKRKAGENIPADPVQAQKEAVFRHAGTLTRWIVRNNLVVATGNPNGFLPPLPPWWDGLYFQRGEKREERRFPGQPAGESLTIRREITGATTKHGFISHQLLTGAFFRFDITLTAWRNLTTIENATWEPQGSAPWSELPDRFELPGGEYFTRTFANVWIQAAYLIPRFELPKRWLNIGQRAAVWISEHPRPDTDPAVIEFEEHLSSANDIQIVDVENW